MIEHASHSKCHIRYVKNAKSFLKPLSQGVYETDKSQKDARDVRYGAEKFCNIRRVDVVPLTALFRGRDGTPKARNSISHSILRAMVPKCLSQYMFSVIPQFSNNLQRGGTSITKG